VIFRIQAPPEKVFPLLADLRRWTDWSPWEGRGSSNEAQGGVGDRRAARGRMMGPWRSKNYE